MPIAERSVAGASRLRERLQLAPTAWFYLLLPPPPKQRKRPAIAS